MIMSVSVALRISCKGTERIWNEEHATISSSGSLLFAICKSNHHRLFCSTIPPLRHECRWRDTSVWLSLVCHFSSLARRKKLELVKNFGSWTNPCFWQTSFSLSEVRYQKHYYYCVKMVAHARLLVRLCCFSPFYFVYSSSNLNSTFILFCRSGILPHSVFTLKNVYFSVGSGCCLWKKEKGKYT